MNTSFQNEIKAAGCIDGVAWGNELATKGQLVRLRRFYNDCPDFEAWFDETEKYGHDITAAESLASIINPAISSGSCDGPCPIELFWNEVTSDDADTDDVDYLQAFVEGALGVGSPAKKKFR